MATINDITTYGVTYIWKDDSSRRKYFGVIGIAPRAVLNYLNDRVDLGDEEWVDFDEMILSYLDSDLGETIESLKSFNNRNIDFLVVDTDE